MASLLQPDHMKEDTLCVLVRGWKCRATFKGKETKAKLADLTAALDGTDLVFVVAQSLVYVDGPQDLVIGAPLVSAHANSGPTEWSVDTARAIEQQLEKELPPVVRTKLEPVLDQAPAGAPSWFLVPTGALASGQCAYGELVDTPHYKSRGDDLIWGCDMNQDAHKKAVRGIRLAGALDWEIAEVDISPERCAALTKTPGHFYVVARYD